MRVPGRSRCGRACCTAEMRAFAHPHLPENVCFEIEECRGIEHVSRDDAPHGSGIGGLMAKLRSLFRLCGMELLVAVLVSGQGDRWMAVRLF